MKKWLLWIQNEGKYSKIDLYDSLKQQLKMQNILEFETLA